ncbi:hypothetical protein B0H16DRAFT_1756702 [Mycena metata]|uniref:Uncharacterized protein n=1 Tax=Mycena metata TaxID=1033252 RepID=A0AAD7NUA9_9AGAR|nr:hypothetical protein B0H16DRAFT_1756702 [Mycena metata]
MCYRLEGKGNGKYVHPRAPPPSDAGIKKTPPCLDSQLALTPARDVGYAQRRRRRDLSTSSRRGCEVGCDEHYAGRRRLQLTKRWLEIQDAGVTCKKKSPFALLHAQTTENASERVDSSLHHAVAVGRETNEKRTYGGVKKAIARGRCCPICFCVGSRYCRDIECRRAQAVDRRVVSQEEGSEKKEEGHWGQGGLQEGSGAEQGGAGRHGGVGSLAAGAGVGSGRRLAAGARIGGCRSGWRQSKWQAREGAGDVGREGTVKAERGGLRNDLDVVAVEQADWGEVGRVGPAECQGKKSIFFCQARPRPQSNWVVLRTGCCEVDVGEACEKGWLAKRNWASSGFKCMAVPEKLQKREAVLGTEISSKQEYLVEVDNILDSKTSMCTPLRRARWQDESGEINFDPSALPRCFFSSDHDDQATTATRSQLRSAVAEISTSENP